MISNHKPKAIAVDLDGTLLNSNKEVSPANRQALRRCIEAGILVVPATSRPLRSSRALLQDTEIYPGAGVFLGGSVAIRPDGVKCVNKFIPQDAVHFVIDVLGKYAPGSWITVESDDEWYANFSPYILDLGAISTYGEPAIMDNSELARQSASKIVAHWDGKPLTEAYSRILDEYGDHLSYVLTMGEEWLEVLPEDTAKERALEVLLDCSGITLEECVAFGDGSNDVTFLAGCGRAVAMANAVPACLTVASYITKSNDEDGFAWAVKEYLGI